MLLYRLTPDDIKDDAIIPLKFVKFQNVSSLTVSTVLVRACWCYKYPITKESKRLISNDKAKFFHFVYNLVTFKWITPF